MENLIDSDMKAGNVGDSKIGIRFGSTLCYKHTMVIGFCITRLTPSKL